MRFLVATLELNRTLLLGVFLFFLGSPVPAECLACKFDGEIPTRIMPEYMRALAALEDFQRKDAVLATHVSSLFIRPQSPIMETVLASSELNPWLYPWIPQSNPTQEANDNGSIDGATPLKENKPAPSIVGFESKEENEDGEPIITLQLKGGEVAWHSPAKANSSRRSGKWYWEVHYRTATSRLPHRGQIGVSPELGSFSHEEHVRGIPQHLFNSLLGGETLQFALNLDKKKLYIGINGIWLIGNPQNLDTGLQLPSGTDIAPSGIPEEPQGESFQPDIFEFNFGANRFRYRIPPGYKAYGAKAPNSASKIKNVDITKTDNRVEQLFLARIEKVSQFDDRTKTLFKETVHARLKYKNTVCALAAKYEGKRASTKDNCMRAFDGQLAMDTEGVYRLVHRMLDHDFKDLPLLDLSEHPLLHAIALDNEIIRREPDSPTINVSVVDHRSPIILFLWNDKLVHWKIDVAPDVKLRHVILFGMDAHTIQISGKAGSITSYSEAGENLDRLWKKLYKVNVKEEFGDAELRSVLRDLFDIEPTSIQLSCKNDLCMIGTAAQ